MIQSIFENFALVYITLLVFRLSVSISLSISFASEYKVNQIIFTKNYKLFFHSNDIVCKRGKDATQILDKRIYHGF